MDLYRRSHEPTPAHHEAGNYYKRAIRWRGLVLRIENEAGSYRSFRNPDGSTGYKRMIYPYGYVAGSTGVDGDEVDCFVGSNLAAPFVYIVHARRKGDWSTYDEDKVFLGFDSREDAEQAFLRCYDDPRFLGPVTTMDAETFVTKARKTKRQPAMIKALLFIRRGGQ